MAVVVPTYRVKDWDKHFEKAQSRGKRCATMCWVPIPNRHDGAGYAAVATHERASDLFSAWILIVEVASKMQPRGTLKKDGKALSARDLSLRTRFPAEIFELAFSVLTNHDIGWLEIID